MFSRRQFLIGSGAALAACASGGCLPPAAAAPGDNLAADRANVYRAHAGRLDALASWCDEQHLPEQAALVRAWLPPRRHDRQYLFVPADFRSPPPATGEFAERFARLRRDEAAALLGLAERAAAARQAALACQLATEAAREDADCRHAWQLLGYVQYQGAWQTPYAVEQLKAGRRWHARFGWLPQADLARYENGERHFRGRWMAADEEARQREELGERGRIETDHFTVTTNVGLAEGVALAEQLERLRAIWQQVFTGYLIDPADLPQRLAAGEALSSPGRKHDVVYYRTRAEYNNALRAEQPQIDMTLGIYLASRHTAYFFAGAEQEPGTIDHEATHQLFHESRPVAKDVGAQANFWIVEAVACHMQSLVHRDGYYTLGGGAAGRMPVARQRYKEGVYLPLAKLVRLGMRDLQEHVDISRLYTQSAGLAAFLLARYPEATAAYLEAVYTDRADVDTLSRLTGADYPRLDREYGEFLAALGG